MTLSRQVPLALAIALIAVPAQARLREERVAAQEDSRRYYALNETTIRIAKIGLIERPAKIKSPGAGGGGVPVLDEVVNIGEKIWKIIADNKPVVDVETRYATALPKGSAGWTQIAGWRVPAGPVYELTARNGFGTEVIRVRYQILRAYGGSYQGKGKYLTAVAVEPLLVEVGWGYRFSMDAEVPSASVVNVGTASEPVAGMMAALHWRVSTPIRESRGQSLYFLQGDGAFREIGGPFASRSLEKTKASVDRARGEALR